jgi:DNA-binding LacI/PurR family transcriptional regulator
VLYGFPIEGSPFPYVSLPLERQGEMLTEHLLSLGHKRFAWLLPARGPLGRSHLLRVEGSRKVLQAAGMPEDALRIFTLDDVPAGEVPVGGDDGSDSCIGQLLPRAGIRGGRVLMRRAMTLSLADRPTALMCVNETTAIGAAAEAQEMGLHLPQDVAIAAANRSVAADLSHISLTTADVDTAEVSKLALELLLETMKAVGSDDDEPMEPFDQAESTAMPIFVSPAPKLIIGRSTQA